MRYIIGIWEVPGRRHLRTHEYECANRQNAIDMAQKLTRNHWQATGVSYTVTEVTEMTKQEVVAAWNELLEQQRVGRAAVARDHEIRREAFYREHKLVLDSLTPEERFEYTIESRQS